MTEEVEGKKQQPLPPPLTMKALAARLTELEGEVVELRVRVGGQNGRLEQMEVARPPELRRLSVESVVAAVRQDPYVTFEILEDWDKQPGSILKMGSTVRAHHVPHLMDYVRHGLLVGTPQDQGKTLAHLRAQHVERAERVQLEAQLAGAAAERAEAVAAEARARTLAYEGNEEVVLEPQEATG